LFQILETCGFARSGLLHTRHGELRTPAIFPVHNLGADAGWNTPRYWDVIPEMNTGMFNASYLFMDKRNRLDAILEKGIHRYIEFPGIAFVDSGGFIYEKYGLSASQQQLLEIQEKSGADIASTLDQPIKLNKAMPENFNICQSVLNAKKALSIRKDSSMLLFASIHGYDPMIIRNVIRHLNKYGEFDGFALGSLMRHFSNYRQIVDLVIAARAEVKDKPLHVYGLGGILVVPLLTYLGVDSVDSSAFITAAAKRDYIVPGYRRVLIHEIERINELCKCPVCTSHSLSEITSKRSLLSLHNIWVLWSELQQIRNALVKGELEEHLKERFAETPWAKAAFDYARRRTRFGLVGGCA